jgi:hypothetical protein
MSRWLDVVFRPDRVSRELRKGERTALTATHLLLNADLRAYLHFARDTEWPSIESAASAPSAYRLPATLLLQLTAESDPVLYEQIALDAERDTGERVLAAALASASYADSWMLPKALQLLEDITANGGFSGLALAYLRTHLSLRAMEAGDWERALDNCSSARKILLEEAGEHAIRDALWEINLINEFWSKQLGLGQISDPRGSYRQRYRARVIELTADALESDLERSFNARFSSRGHTIQFGGTDSSEQALRGALLRSEVLGDFNQIIDTRKNLGKYLLLSAAGSDARPSAVGFALLFRAREATALARATGEYVHQGPMEAVMEFGSQLVEVDWAPVVVEASLKFLEQAADVLDRRRVDSLLTRLCDSYANLIRPTAFLRAESDALSAITEVTRVAAPSMQSIAARFGLSLARSTSDGLTLQSLRPLPDAIDWAKQPAAIVDDWIEFIQAALNDSDAKKMFAEAALFALLSVRAEELLEILRRSRPNSTTIATAALVGDFVQRLGDDEANAAAADVASVLRRTREAAAKGSYSMGATYDAPAILGALVIQRRDLQGYWREVVDYVCDPAVIRADKVGILRVLADQFKRIPNDVIDSLRQQFGTIRAADVKEFFPSAGFESVWLRLGSLLGALDEYQTLQELLKLASNSVTSLRQEAAEAAPFVRVADDSAILAIVLLLSRDSDSLVRAAATRALLRREWSETDQKGLVWTRVIELLSEPGRTPTVGVVRGLLDGVTSNEEIPPTITARVHVLAQEHPSWLVRTVAQRLEDRWKDEKSRAR